jgi:zinc/manganese transport system substrate-binding protein
MKRSVFTLAALASTLAAALVLAGCSASADPASTAGSDSSRLAVVASTNVWGDVA